MMTGDLQMGGEPGTISTPEVGKVFEIKENHLQNDDYTEGSNNTIGSLDNGSQRDNYFWRHKRYNQKSYPN